MELDIRPFAAALGHTIPVTIAESRPVEATHFPFAQLVGHAANVGHKVVGRSRIVVHVVVMHARLVARAHGTAPFCTHRAVNVLAHFALEAVFPALFGGNAHVPERVFVHREKATFKTRVVGNVGHIPGKARTV